MEISSNQPSSQRTLAEDSRYASDQASRLREMACPSTSSHLAPGSSTDTPHVVLFSEYPANQGIFPLALQMVNQLQRPGQPSLIADLSPCASRLRACIDARGYPLRHWPSGTVQPLWREATHGRTLALKADRQPMDITFVAQPPGDHPTVAQMPRFCEQLLRLLQHRELDSHTCIPRPQFERVYLFSESIGVPLDHACWQSADEIVLLCPQPIDTEQLASSLAVRLPRLHQGQRIVLLSKPNVRQPRWRMRCKVQRCESVRLPISDSRCDVQHLSLGGYPLVPRIDSPMTMLAKALIRELQWSSTRIRIRQAG